ncbi:hypothetical protein ACLOJK_028200, partial [Asimina triloba]
SGSSKFSTPASKRRKGQPNNELPKVRGIEFEELERGQRAVLEFLQLHSLKWHSAKGAFFQWCQDLPLLGASGTSPKGELEGRLRGKKGAGQVLIKRPREQAKRSSNRTLSSEQQKTSARDPPEDERVLDKGLTTLSKEAKEDLAR